tara:strand:+ start:33 stop:1364 length:1332 start_codon:yes stop_codon:yes gene_type:complete
MSKLQVDDIVNKEDNGSVGFSRGAVVTGVCTATSFSGGASGDFSIEDKIVHTGDTDTAIRFPAANTFAIETGGNEKIRVDASETIIRVNSASHQTFRFTTAGSNEAKLVMRDASDNDDIILSTGGVSVFNGGNFGIGQASPTKKLEVATGAVSFSPDTAGKHTHEFTTNAANDGRYKILANTTTKVDIQANGDTFFDGGDVSIGSQSPLNGAQLTVAGKGIAITGQNTDHSANSMRLGEEGSGAAQIRCYGPGTSTNGSLTLRSSRSDGTNGLDVSLLANGNLSISDGNLVVASGHGIDFSATGSGTGTDTSELLDDYEEGTWTPNVGGNTTYTGQSGSYTKIGRSVTARFQFTINVLGTGSNQRIENLPFAVAGSNVGECAGPVSYFANLHTARGSLTCYAGSSTNRVYFNSITGDAAAMGINQVVFQNSTVMWGTVTYFTN